MTRSQTQDKVPVPKEIWVLVASAFCIAIGFGLVAPVLPQFAHSFDVGLAAASAIVTVFALTRLAFAPPAGWLISRFGERRMYVAGLALVALSSFLCAFAQGYIDLLLYRALGGIGSVTFTVAGMGLLVRLAPPAARGRTSALYGTSFLLGNVLGPILGTALSFLGYRWPFVIYGFLILLSLSVVAVFLREEPRGEKPTDERPKVSLGEVLRVPHFRALLGSGFANGWSNFGVRIAMIPLMAAGVPTIGAQWAGAALTLFAVGNVVGQQFTGRLVDSVGRRPVLMAGLLLSGVTTVFFGWMVDVVWFLALSVLSGMGASMVAPASQALLADIIGSDRNGGPALSTFSMATDLGSIAGTMVVGVIADALGFGWAFAVTGLVLFASVVPWALVRSTLERA